MGALIYVLVPALLTAGWFFYNPWNSQSVRLLRDSLFGVRDKLFAFAADPAHPIDFEDVAYGMLRANLNGYIRFAESYHLITALRLQDIKRPDGVLSWAERWEKYLGECSPQVAKSLRDLHEEAVCQVLRHLFRTSLFGVLLIAGVKCRRAFAARMSSASNQITQRVRQQVEAAGEAYGEEQAFGCLQLAP